MPASTQLISDEERGPISPANSDAGVHESEGGKKGSKKEFLVSAVRASKERVNVVRLLPSGAQERKLMRLADLSAKLWNELNYERRQQWNGGHRVDLEGTWRKYHEKYKGVLGSHNAVEVINKNNEAWGSFFSLLKSKKEGKLPKHWRVSPPGYWKDREEEANLRGRGRQLRGGRSQSRHKDQAWEEKETAGDTVRRPPQVVREAGEDGDPLRRGQEGLARVYIG